jgi:MFS family permease
MTRALALGFAIGAAAVAAVPVVAYVFPRHPNWLDPYESRSARWMVYIGGGIALALFIALARTG